MAEKSFNATLVETFEKLTTDEITKLLDRVKHQAELVKKLGIDYKALTGYDLSMALEIRETIIKRKEFTFKQYKALNAFVNRSEKFICDDVHGAVNELLEEIGIKKIS